LIQTIQDYNRIANYYTAKIFYKSKGFKNFFVTKLRKFSVKYYLYNKFNYYKALPSNHPYLKLFRLFDFDKKSIYKEYNKIVNDLSKYRKEKFFSNANVNFKNKTLNLNINYLYFFGYSYFFLQHYNVFDFSTKLAIDFFKKYFINFYEENFYETARWLKRAKVPKKKN